MVRVPAGSLSNAAFVGGEYRVGTGFLGLISEAGGAQCLEQRGVVGGKGRTSGQVLASRSRGRLHSSRRSHSLGRSHFGPAHIQETDKQQGEQWLLFHNSSERNWDW